MVQLVNLPYLGFLHISLTIRGKRGVKLKTDRAIAAIGVILIGPNFIDFAQLLLVASPIVHIIGLLSISLIFSRALSSSSVRLFDRVASLGIK